MAVCGGYAPATIMAAHDAWCLVLDPGQGPVVLNNGKDSVPEPVEVEAISALETQAVMRGPRFPHPPFKPLSIAGNMAVGAEGEWVWAVCTHVS